MNLFRQYFKLDENEMILINSANATQIFNVIADSIMNATDLTPNK